MQAPGATGDAEAHSDADHTKRLEQLNGLFNIALNNMARGLSMFDAEGRLIVGNEIYRTTYGLPDALIAPGTPFAEIIAFHARRENNGESDLDRQTQHQWLERYQAEIERGRTFTHVERFKDGRVIQITTQPLSDGGWVDIQEDVTERTRDDERTSWLARHDPVTEVANRFYLREVLDREIAKAADGSMVAIHWIDLDRFKVVNDTLGHAAGDALLKSVAQRLRSVVRADDFVGRLGGDEFAVIQPGIKSPADAERLAKRLLSVLDGTYRVLGNTATVSASVGVVIAPLHGTDVDDLFEKADQALGRVKAGGRGGYEVYAAEDSADPWDRVQLEKALRRALAAGQIELHYQPIVNLATREVSSCEALMRWHHPSLGMVPPSTFIPIAEGCGVIAELGRWAITQACLEAATWANDVKVTVNVSAAQFALSDLTEVVAEALACSGLPARRLELEITESVLMRDEPRTRETLERIRGLGVGIALDDFGTMFASLSYLCNFRFDKIKIDRSFVRDLSQRKDCQAVINAVTGLARALEIASVAEGIETDEQLDRVTQAGCAEVQGFYFSRPVPNDEIAAAFEHCAAKLAGTV